MNIQHIIMILVSNPRFSRSRNLIKTVKIQSDDLITSNYNGSDLNGLEIQPNWPKQTFVEQLLMKL